MYNDTFAMGTVNVFKRLKYVIYIDHALIYSDITLHR